MTDQFTRQAQEIFAAAKEARIPENVQAIVENSVAKTREAYSTMNSAAKDGVKVLEDVMVAAHAGAKTIGEKILRNTEANAEAAFDAARAISRAGLFLRLSACRRASCKSVRRCQRSDQGTLRAFDKGGPADVRDNELGCYQDFRTDPESSLSHPGRLGSTGRETAAEKLSIKRRLPWSCNGRLISAGGSGQEALQQARSTCANRPGFELQFRDVPLRSRTSSAVHKTRHFCTCSRKTWNLSPVDCLRH